MVFEGMQKARKSQFKLAAAGVALLLLTMLAGPAAFGLADFYNGKASDGEYARWQTLSDADVRKVVFTYTNITVEGVGGTGVTTTYQLDLTTEVTADTINMASAAAAAADSPYSTGADTGINIEILNTTVLQQADYNKSSYLTIYLHNTSVNKMLKDSVTHAQYGFEVVDKAIKDTGENSTDTRSDSDLQHVFRGYFEEGGYTLFETKKLDFDGTSGYEFETGDYTVNASLPAKALVKAAAEKEGNEIVLQIDDYEAARGGADSVTFGVGFNVPDAKGRASFETVFMTIEGIWVGLLFFGGLFANPRVTAYDIFGQAKKLRKRGGAL